MGNNVTHGGTMEDMGNNGTHGGTMEHMGNNGTHGGTSPPFRLAIHITSCAE